MRSSLARLGVVAFSVIALFGTTTPAKADTVLAAAYVAQITVSSGLGYPVLTLPAPTPHVLAGTPLTTVAHLIDGTHPSSNCLQLPNDFGEDPLCLTNSHWTYDHPQSISVSSDECVDVAANINKPTKAPAHAGDCVFSTINITSKPNTISGHCGLSSGQIQVTFTDALGQSYHLDLHFKTAFTVVLVSGHFRKLDGSGQHGLIVSVATATPRETTIPTTTGPTCTAKTQRNFVVVGVAAAVSDPRL